MLKVADIDSEHMLLRVERGKGGQYRNALLSADLLSLPNAATPPSGRSTFDAILFQ